MALPAVSLSATIPPSSVLAVPTIPSESAEAAATLLGACPVKLEGALAREKAKGEAGEIVSVPVPAEAGAAEALERVLAVGVGNRDLASLRKAAAAVVRRAASADDLAVDLRGLELDRDGLRAFAEAGLLAAYRFTRKQTPTPAALRTIVLVVSNPKALQPALDRAVVVARATAAARDLVNTPSLEKSPQWLADTASTLLSDLTVRVRDAAALAKAGFGGIVAVGQGSTRPPCLIEATYDGGGRRHVVLVGKGITFDTGGLSLKPNEGMLAMKTDMGGGAAVLGALRAVADLRLRLKVTALVAAAENMPSGTAQRPGDVIRHYGGTTVEVLNTDAEGRLVLADAIAYADHDLKADVIIDVATLTGAMPVALGKRTAGMFCNDDLLAAQLEAASAASGERAWRMPLVEDYRSALESPVADLRNIGLPRLKLGGGSITAALFLREFTGGRPWAHLDIAGPARCEADDDELTKGGTGYGVRLLTRWLEELADKGHHQ